MKPINKVTTKLIFICILFYNSPLIALELSGYVSGIPSLIVQQPTNDTWWQMLVHNRLNLGWQMTEYFRADAGVRNRFITGSEDIFDPQSFSYDPGWVDLSWNWGSVHRWHGRPLLANTSLDRLNVTFEKDNWKLQAGRQRINWGQTFVWNPNDIFNTYSFFDVDYPERPGCDSFRGTYYHNATSSSELAVSVNYENKVTSAFLHRWNHNNVDYQFLIGQHTETDLVLGGAITSDFSGLNLRSEMSYFHPIRNSTDTSGIVAVSVGADYIFTNSLMLQAEVLYNNVNDTFSENGLMGLYAAPLSAKYLSICNWNVFVQTSYPITSRLNGSLAGMYFVDIQSYFAGFSLDFSVIENLDLSFIAQYFSTLDNSKLENIQMFLGFVGMKYSF